MALLTFDDNGTVINVLRLGKKKFGPETCPAAQVPSDVWHTVIALESGCVLFETKAGPFDPNQPKDLASWAPDEGSAEALAYLNLLVGLVEMNPNG